jgi:hypothetical protein
VKRFLCLSIAVLCLLHSLANSQTAANQARIDSLVAQRDSLNVLAKALDAEIRRFQISQLETDINNSAGREFYVTTKTDVGLRLRSLDGHTTDVTIPGGTRLKALSYNGISWQVIYHEGVGTINPLDISADSETRNVLYGRYQARRRISQEKQNLETSTRIVLASIANVRTAPEKDATIVAKLSRGDRVYVRSSQPQWLNVVLRLPSDAELEKIPSIEHFADSLPCGWMHESVFKEPTRSAPPKEVTDPFFRCQDAIKVGKVTLRMTKDQILRLCGSPDDVNRSVGEWGVHEQWIYTMSYSSIYLYFENGVLTSWQD